MDRQPPPSLPRLRDMVDVPEARETTAPPNASWTPINQLPRPEGPVSPRTRHANPQLNRQSSPPSHHQTRSDNRTLPQDQVTATSFSTDFGYGGVSFDGHPAQHQTAGKPITARQDSAVFASAPSQAPASLLPVNTSRSGRSPEIYHRSVRDTATHPLTPPSDPFSHQSYSRTVPTHPPTYARAPVPPSIGPHQDAPAMNSQHGRENSDPEVNSRDVPPVPHTALFTEKNTMPPPPVPPSTFPSELLTTEPSIAPQQAPRYSPDVANADDKGSTEKCEFCNAVWTYPLLNTLLNTEGVPQRASRTPQEMSQNMGALFTRLSDYQSKKDAHFKQWKQRHSGGHCNCKDHQSGSKRKLEESAEDKSPPPKLQKRDSKSPPPTSHLTPPPDLANGEAESRPFQIDPKTNSRLADTVSRVLGPYKPPRHDSDGMFHDVHGEGQRVKTEETAH